MAKSWKPLVKTDDTGEFYANGLRFATKEEAEANARDLMSRWMLVHTIGIAETDDEVNYAWRDGALVKLEGAE